MSLNNEFRVVPGGRFLWYLFILDRLGSCEEFECGDGVFADKGIIYSLIVGIRKQKEGPCLLLICFSYL